MKIGIGLPTLVAPTNRDLVLGWARLADEGRFATVSVGELVTTPGYDALATLAAVAAVTERVRLMTNVLALPLHNEGILAKQAATIDVLSGGRLTLGLGVGGKKPILFDLTADPSAHANFPDYAAAPAPYQGRTERFHQQVAYMRRLWAGEPPMEDVPPVGPAPAQPGGPELLAGSFAPAAIRRAAAWAQGLTIFDHGANADKVEKDFRLAEEAWRDLRRAAPRLVASFYFALGPDVIHRKQRFLDSHYGHLSPDGKQRIGDVIRCITDTAVSEAIQAFTDIGADEVILVPIISELDQVRRLRELVG